MDSTLPSIPRLIFLTWKLRRIPEAVQPCVASFQRRNPDWQVVVASDEDCLKWLAARRPVDLLWYEKLPAGILRADAIRLLWLHTYGGVYADIDVECFRSLDDLVAQLEASSASLGLPRDHPIHERIHFKNTPMWMNDFMIARPGAPALGEALRILQERVESGKKIDPRHAVMQTGPGLLNEVIAKLGGVESSGVLHLPWEIIHPLPDLTNEFPEKAAVESSIRQRDWRQANPYVAHYWYHTWCSTRNMIVTHREHLFADASEALRERLAKYAVFLGPRLETVSEALAEITSQPQPVIVELGIARSFITEPPPGVNGADHQLWKEDDPAGWDWGAGCFTRVAVEALRGYDFHYHGVDSSLDAQRVAQTMLSPLRQVAKAGEHQIYCEITEHLGTDVFIWKGSTELANRVHWHPCTAREFLENFSGQADLIYMDHGECSEETSRMHEADARLILGKNLIKEGGYVLIDDHLLAEGKDLRPKSNYSRDVFEQAGWRVVAEGRQLLMQRPYEVEEFIPRMIHIFQTDPANESHAEIAQRWTSLHPGWEIKHWGAERVRDFVLHECPEFLETFVSYRSETQRMSAGKLLILKRLGGLAISTNIVPLRNLEELLAGRPMYLIPQNSVQPDDNDEPSFDKSIIREDFVACCAGHPFWDGLEYDLEIHHRGNVEASTGGVFLARRLRDGLRFLSKDFEWPELLDAGVVADPASGQLLDQKSGAWLQVFGKCSADSF
jgi:mannosyltransferase OCH1-like enzyme